MYYLSTDQAGSVLAQFLEGRSVAALAAGQADAGAPVSVTLSPFLSEGTYYVVACADDPSGGVPPGGGGYIAESNEANNCLASAAIFVNVYGQGIVNAGEECDDGNTLGGVGAARPAGLSPATHVWGSRRFAQGLRRRSLVPMRAIRAPTIFATLVRPVFAYIRLATLEVYVAPLLARAMSPRSARVRALSALQTSWYPVLRYAMPVTSATRLRTVTVPKRCAQQAGMPTAMESAISATIAPTSRTGINPIRMRTGTAISAMAAKQSTTRRKATGITTAFPTYAMTRIPRRHTR